jgi:MoaA/NifB/PqqE/SkfB family radical SAM enzyme
VAFYLNKFMVNPPIDVIHVEPTNICTLKCPGCARTRFLREWPKRWKNHNLDINHLLDFLDIDLTNKIIYMSGVYGDPIYHVDFIDFVSKLKSRGCKIHVVTNGSYKSQHWWQNLVSILENNDTVEFSIDGIPENFNQYRINADWSSIEKAIKICVAKNINTIWKFIPFSYNQDNIKEAQELSQSLGIKKFKVLPSDRFDEQTMIFLPRPELRGQRLSVEKNIQSNDQSQIFPKCMKGDQHFISADGFFSPCCFLADHRFYYKTQFGKQKSKYDIRKTTLTKIFNEPEVRDFYDSIHNFPPDVCRFHCSTKN